MNPLDGYQVLKLAKTNSSNWISYGSSFNFIPGKTLPAPISSGKVIIFPYSSDPSCSFNVAGILVDDVELLPNFGFMEKSQVIPCGISSIVNLTDLQMPTYNFHNPTYKVYDLSGNLVSNSLSFNFSITNPTKLIIKRQLEVNGVILPSINSILCEGIDTVELIPGPQSVSMIQIIQPAICKNNLILSTWMTNQMIYDWKTPYGNHQYYSFQNTATFINPQTGWYKCNIIPPSGCGYVDSIYVTVTDTTTFSNYAQSDFYALCSSTITINGDVNNITSNNFTFKWYLLGDTSTIGTGKTLTTLVNENTTYIVEITSTSAPYCKYNDTVHVTIQDRFDHIIEILTKCITQGDSLKLKCSLNQPGSMFRLRLPNGAIMYQNSPNAVFTIASAQQGWYYLQYLPPGGNCLVYDSVYIQYDISDCSSLTANSPFENRTLTEDMFHQFYYELTAADTNYFKDNPNIVIGIPIKVPSGLKFTISNCNIKMKKCGIWVVDKYAELKIINSHIGGCRWQGIEVWGNVSSCAPDPVQGKLTLLNSVISNADIAVFLGKRTSGHPGLSQLNAGGILIATNDSFYNNAYDIVFDEYIGDFLSEFVTANGDPSCPSLYSGKDLYITNITSNYFGPRWPEECCNDFVKQRLIFYSNTYNVFLTDFHVIDFGDVRFSVSFPSIGISDLCRRQIRRVFNSNMFFTSISQGFGRLCIGLTLPPNNIGYR